MKKCPYDGRKCDYVDTKVCERLRGGKRYSYAMCVMHPMLGGKIR